MNQKDGRGNTPNWPAIFTVDAHMAAGTAMRRRVNVPVEAPLLQTDEEKILANVREHGSIKRAECQALLNVTETQARYILKKMKDRLLLRLEGTGKPSRYLLPENIAVIQT